MKINLMMSLRIFSDVGYISLLITCFILLKNVLGGSVALFLIMCNIAVLKRLQFL